MSRVKEAVCKKDGLRAWTIITDCLLYGGETLFPLRARGAIIKEYK
jgi:hypothetical protein